MIFKVLPDVKIAWRDVWVGAVVTSVLFAAGKFLLAWYLGRSTTISAYGAAGSIVLVLLWVYYSAQILFFGAEVTKVYANRFGARLQPSAYARWSAPHEVDKQTAAKAKLAKVESKTTSAEPSNDHEDRMAKLNDEIAASRRLLKKMHGTRRGG